MKTFFRVTPILTEETITIDLSSHQNVSFTLGARFNPPIKEPIQFKVDHNFPGTTLPTLFFPEPVVSINFLEQLRKAGVENIDDYEVQIKNKKNQIKGYRAINIIGQPYCADLDKSEFEEFDGMYSFDHLVIDPNKTMGLQFFRIAESAEFVLITGELASKMNFDQFPDVNLLPIDISA